MNIFQAFVLSVIEGLTEFLPISSTGHLILASYVLGITPTAFTKSFDIAIQLGAILAVVVLYYPTLQKNHSLFKPIALAFLPTAVVGFLLYDLIKTYLLESTLVTILALAIGGILLILSDHFLKKNSEGKNGLTGIYGKQALVIGIAQSLSVIPGVSRAAATILGGVATGLNKEKAVEFSFLLAVPTIVAATAYDLMKSRQSFATNEIYLLFVGFLGAFFSAIVSIKFFLTFVKTRSFSLFGVYRILLAFLFFVLFGTG